MAEIVPIDDALLVEAYVLPQDIAFLRPDQPVRVKLTAYDFTRYGALEGRILRIGADAVRRSERDEAEVFVIVVRTEGALYDADGAQVRIIPGMTAEIDILAGRRRVIDYLLQPLERVRARAHSRSEIELIPYEDAYEPGFEDFQRRVPSIEKIMQTIDWQPTTPLDETIDQIIAYYKERK